MNILRPVVLALLVATPLAAQAQPDEPVTPEQKWMLVSTQLTENLNVPIDGIRTQTLKNTIVFATLYRDKVDMRRSERALRNVFETSPSSLNRKLAVAALQAIGNPYTADYLARNVTSAETEESRFLVASVLNEYYLSRADAGP